MLCLSCSILLCSVAVLGKPGRAGIGIFLPVKWRRNLGKYPTVVVQRKYIPFCIAAVHASASQNSFKRRLGNCMASQPRNATVNCSVEEGEWKVKLECSTSVFHYHDENKTRQLDEVSQWEHFLFRKCVFRTFVLEWLRCHVHQVEKEDSLVKIGVPRVLLFCTVH